MCGAVTPAVPQRPEDLADFWWLEHKRLCGARHQLRQGRHKSCNCFSLEKGLPTRVDEVPVRRCVYLGCGQRFTRGGSRRIAVVCRLGPCTVPRRWEELYSPEHDVEVEGRTDECLLTSGGLAQLSFPPGPLTAKPACDSSSTLHGCECVFHRRAPPLFPMSRGPTQTQAHYESRCRCGSTGTQRCVN